MNKKAFSFVELLIVVSILVVLWVIVTAVVNNVWDKAQNSRVVADLGTIQTALINKQQSGKLPLPKWNLNFFDENGHYVHDDFTNKEFTNTWTFWVYGKVTENLLAKKDLDMLPLDPRTKNYYSYGITKTRDEFQLAGAIKINDEFIAKVETDNNEKITRNKLIRQYNWADFVEADSGKLPYNPYEKLLVATTRDWKVYKKWDTIEAKDKDLEIYFGDGSMVLLQKNWILTLTEASFPKEDGLITKVKLFLNSGVAWVKATKLAEEDNDGSSFEIFTDDTNASVRGTMFEMKATDDDYTWVKVYAWEVELTRIVNNEKNILKWWQKGKVYSLWPETINDASLTPENFPEFWNPTNNEKIVDLVDEDEEENFVKAIKDKDCKNSFKLKNSRWDEISSCIKNNLWDDWKVVAYAPYDKVGDLKMYTGSVNVSSSSGWILNTDGTDIEWTNLDKLHLAYSWVTNDLTDDNLKNSFANFHFWRTKWILIDNQWWPDFLKYTFKESLWDDFAIEMRVKGLNRNDSNSYYLFDSWKSWNLKAYLIKWEITIKSDYQELTNSTSTWSLNINNNFYNIFIIKDNDNLKVKLDNKDINMSKNTFSWSININDLVIWAFSWTTTYKNQWNDIIDYVKIYKK